MLSKNDKYVIKEEQERLGSSHKKRHEGNSEANDKGNDEENSWKLESSNRLKEEDLGSNPVAARK